MKALERIKLLNSVAQVRPLTEDEQVFVDLWHKNTALRKSLKWLVEDAKWRFKNCKNELEPGSQSEYSPELTIAIELLK